MTLRNFRRSYSRDERLASMLTRMATTITMPATNFRRPPRSYIPTPAAIERMGIYHLVRETVAAYRHDASENHRYSTLAARYDALGLPIAAGVVAAGLTVTPESDPVDATEGPTRADATIEGVARGFDAYFTPGEFSDLDTVDEFSFTTTQVRKEVSGAEYFEQLGHALAAVEDLIPYDPAQSLHEQSAMTYAVTDEVEDAVYHAHKHQDQTLD